MTALQYAIQLNQGETSSLIFPVIDQYGTPVSVAGWTGKSQIRACDGAPAVLYEWSAAHSNITVSGTSVTLRCRLLIRPGGRGRTPCTTSSSPIFPGTCIASPRGPSSSTPPSQL